jgi:glycine/D-amino acid oxidase-like deaminating enzyme
MQLFERGIPFTLFHSGELPCSSEKAAGLMNPMVVKRLLPTWLADVAVPYNRQFYRKAEQLTGERFFTPLAVHRLFPNEQSLQEWKRRVDEGTMNHYISNEVYDYRPDVFFSSGFGGGDIFQAASVDCGLFISSLRRFFSDRGFLVSEGISYDKIQPEGEGVKIYGKEYSSAVFCEGMQLKNNPWFGYLPLVPTKGELLWLEIDDLPSEKEVMKGIFLAPRLHGGFVCGSTYDWQFETEEPTAAGREKLKSDLEKIIKVPYRIVNHTAGVRPAARDRRPFLGSHREFKQLYVFNGLGTKGYMLAPVLSEMLCDYITRGKPLPKEADIRRFDP